MELNINVGQRAGMLVFFFFADVLRVSATAAVFHFTRIEGKINGLCSSASRK